MVNKLLFTGVGVAGFVAGFELDRRIADTPYRQDRRLPDIARRERADDYLDYDEQAPPKLDGEGAHRALSWYPVLGTAVGLTAMATAARLIPKDRIWSTTIAGRGAIGVAVAGAAMTAGVLSSRAILG